MLSGLCLVQVLLRWRVSGTHNQLPSHPRINKIIYLSRHFERIDLVKRDNGDAFLQLAVLQQFLADLLVFDDHIK